MRRGLEPISVKPSPPYRITPHLDRYCPSGEPMPCIYDGGSKRWRSLVSIRGEMRPLALNVRSEGQNPLVHVLVEDDLDRDRRREAQSTASWILALDVDYMGFMGRTAGTPLHSIAWRGFGLRPARATSVYEALLMALVWGQGKPSSALSALVRSAGPSIVVQGEEFYGPPDPERVKSLGLDGLKSLGFSQQRAEAVLAVSAAVSSGSLPTMEEASENPRKAARAFAEIPGVGRSAAEVAASLISRRPWSGFSPEAMARRISEATGVGYGARDLEDLLGEYLGLAYYLVGYVQVQPTANA
ncbi:MAG: hypothetical protein ACP5GT_01995 [Conexivisphaera sp.]